MKVAIYVRVSTSKQEAENQISQLKDWCFKNKYDIYRIYTDVISGKEKKRPAFNELYKDARKLLFDLVLFWDLSRFSRAGLHHTIDKLYELENLNIKWHSYQEPYMSTQDEISKNIILAVLSTFAKVERKRISERTKAGLERVKKSGKRLGRPVTSKYQQKIAKKLYKELGSYRAVSKRMHLSRNTVKKYVKKGLPEKPQENV